jgi:hypothetical protein
MVPEDVVCYGKEPFAMTDHTLPTDRGFAEPASDAQLARAAKALGARNVTVHTVDTIAEARRVVLDLLPKDQGVLTALSETLRLSGNASSSPTGARSSL